MENYIEINKPWKEKFFLFLKDPTRSNFRNLLQFETVEDDDLDFKRELPTKEYDSLAKHILAMANKKGGVIVFGVEEITSNEFSLCGLSEFPDITDIEKKLAAYLPTKLEIDIIPISFGEDDLDYVNKKFLVIIVKYNPKYIPFLALKSGNNIKDKSIIYIRRHRASEPINYDELQEVLNARIETEYSTTDERKLIEHLEELRELYNHIPKTIRRVISYKPPTYDPPNLPILGDTISQELQKIKKILGETKYENFPNPDYPEESYEAFIKKLIEVKKEVLIKFIKNHK